MSNNRTKYTDEQKNFIMDMAKRHSAREVMEAFNDKYGCNVSYHAIRSFLNYHQCDKTYQEHIYSKEEIQYLRFLFFEGDFTTKEIAELFNHKFDTCVSVKSIRYKINHEGWTAGKSWKRQASYNKLPIGSERFYRSCIWIKTAQPTTWTRKHRYLWEQAYGPIPDKCCVIFIDGNPKHCYLDNLACVTMADRFSLIKYDLFYHTKDELDTCLTLIRLRQKINQKKKKVCNRL